ncbi:MAG: AbrB/MazE/SpoVT family DNA-binding domain-containing protein [Verrucomicrobia bacterium]|nr:MAG: AbrB/MazE/SpoVT family DNA-binding domain-containing protein [Verrucomicrobiota bacterium]
MQTIATTKMTSKGQVVIPEAIRKSLHLETGNQFVVVADHDVVILKTIKAPEIGEFDALLSKARKQAKTAGMKKSDISAAIAAVRK